ncbi:alkylhydroperoxidase [Prauserella marina]|uniref:Alkylhydroperoxidase AhpD family core domain-containing protein n=1 Tax=Prauserella marina TaxID=530584 RepID=A0A222VQ41_9PSEU|nr:carboxymuconolactone decarboxylase family protein [Prauserella marina]ASR36027.1 alkylhydroperoxidase [Prauserella marina]PWV84022.1 AhpD family alkylhydroperoxidase [Prauserella marina]SDC32261.1 alkylhydroperoxidase AhpD family core domain-containing protein [Prauserella marina]
MPRIAAADQDTAPERSRAVLAELTERSGQVGPMVATMAHSPALLMGYLELSRAMKRATLPRALSEKISLALQQWIGCELCLAAHTRAARKAGVTESGITLARQGVAADERETALLTFAVRVLAEPSGLTDADIAELGEHGWTERIIADVVGLVALNQLTGSFNLVAGLHPAPAA